MTSLKTTQECVITFTNLIQTSSNLQQKKKEKSRVVIWAVHISSRSDLNRTLRYFGIWDLELIGSIAKSINRITKWSYPLDSLKEHFSRLP